MDHAVGDTEYECSDQAAGGRELENERPEG